MKHLIYNLFRQYYILRDSYTRQALRELGGNPDILVYGDGEQAR